jgi:hypothetical protein
MAMGGFSTNQVAKKLGIGTKTLSRYIAEKKVPPPKILEVGGSIVHIWTAADIETVRRLLPKIANGRKARRSRKKKTSTQQTRKKQR